MSDETPDAFDDMGGEFEARLKRNTVSTRTSVSDGRELTISNPLAILEARFSFKALDRLYFPSFIAIERVVAGSTKFMVYEVIGVNPTHYQLPGVDSSMPTLLRKEYLDTINESWGKSQETWIDLAAIPTSYMAQVDGKKLDFSRSPLVPLPGSKAYLLSRDSVRTFLCEAKGERIGTMVGFDLPFTVSMENLIRFHCGFFAFTGSGKSNLISSLVRTAMKSDPNLTVVVLDIAGEYAVNLLDLLGDGSRLMSTERFESEDEFGSSQAIPESIESRVGREKVEDALGRSYRRGVEWLSLQESGGLDLGWIQQLLQSTVEGGKTGATAAKVYLVEFTAEFFDQRALKPTTKLADLDGDSKASLNSILDRMLEAVHGMSALTKDLAFIKERLDSSDPGPAATSRLTPEKLAENLGRGTAARLNILYMPEPQEARQVVSRLITRLLFLKKKLGNKQRVLFVLDEAQEYIPDNPTERQYTVSSNLAVEQLLRQGRKYRLHCWLATQRVAHLNVNALQQLHSYFVSTLPRMYDRMVIADAFALHYDVLERSAGLETGEWMFVSFKAAKQRNVPVFIGTENNEDRVVDFMTK